MKKTLSTLLIAVLLLLVGMPAYAEIPINVQTVSYNVFVNNERLIDTTEYPIIESNGVTYIPLTSEVSAQLGIRLDFVKNSRVQLYMSSVVQSNVLPQATKPTRRLQMSKSTLPLFINNALYDNPIYPTLEYNSIFYLPLTWESATTLLNWNLEWSDSYGLFINTNSVDNNTNHNVTSRGVLTTEEIGKLASAIVLIETDLGTGSGVTLTGDGTIVTNYHVIENASWIKIHYEDLTNYMVDTIIGSDSFLDLALLKIDTNDKPFIQLGDSSTLSRGQNIVTIGSPEGLFNTLSTGVISRFDEDFIQITAPISSGSSGGALLNEQGQLIGITTAAILSGENLGFAIPVQKIGQVDTTVSETLDSMPEAPVTISSPHNLRVETLNSTSAYINWDPVEGADYYHFYYQEAGDDSFWYDEDEFYGGPMRFRWFMDYTVEYYNLDPNTHYNVLVTAVVDGIESDDSDVLSFKTKKSAGHAPAHLTGEAISDSVAVLNWTRVPKADYYLVYWSHSTSDGFEVIRNTNDEPLPYEWSSAGVTIYFLDKNAITTFKVCAVINGRETELSDPVQVLTGQ